MTPALLRSPAWCALPLAARGIVADVLAAMGDRPELELGPQGLRALAAFLSATWDELEPLLALVLGAGVWLRYDAARQVLAAARPAVSGFSPRFEALPSSAPAAAPSPPASADEPSKAALRARAWRAARKTAAAALAAAQLPFEFANANGANANANATNALEGVRCGNAERSTAFANAPLSLSSSSSIHSRKQREGAARVTLDTDAPPQGWLERAAELRPDLPRAAVERSWRRFALAKTDSLPSWSVVQSRWESWLERERMPAAAPSEPPPAAPVASPKASADEPRPAPYHRPAAPPRPDHEPPASSPRPVVRRAPVDPAVVAAAARLAAGDFLGARAS